MKIIQLKEARYFRHQSLGEVYAAFAKLRDSAGQGDVQVLDAEHNSKSVYVELRVWVESEEEAWQAIDKFLDHHDLPQMKRAEINMIHNYDWRAVLFHGEKG